jgi:hypothetical protein
MPQAAGRTTFTHDLANRSTGIKFWAATLSTRFYNGFGLRRTAQEPGGSLTTMIWDGDDYLGEV